MNTIVRMPSMQRYARLSGLVAVATLVSSPALLAPMTANAADMAMSSMSAKVYGDLSVAFVETGASVDGGKSSYSLYDNVSLLGVKGEAGVMDGTKFIYDYNAILDIVNGGGSVTTHLGTVGLDGSFGTVTVGRDNALYLGMVDGSSYQTNWFYTAGMSSLQVSKSIKYVSSSMSGLQLGVEAFDIAKDSTTGKTTNNYTLAGTYAMKAMTFGAGYTKYSDYANTAGGVVQYAVTNDTNQFGVGNNSFAGIAVKSLAGASAAYKTDMFGVVAAIDSRKPNDAATNTSALNTFMLTGNFMASKTVNLIGNVSSTKQSDKNSVDGKKGTVVTLMAGYTPVTNVTFTAEVQSSNKDANVNSITGATGAGGTKSSTGFALGAMYAF